ncbi:phospholipase D family protein [Brevundimonas sp.]|uniref:phospholipase D family protein n=1 Tax=Brevundimonas sp. TaxID=1871086 RepID=UPI0025C261BE|nr:phospholipase D family protein [Brevundimonas sp.]
MRFNQLLCGPEWSHLSPIVKGKLPILVSAFYGDGMLTKVAAAKPVGAKLLVRLPRPAGAIPKLLPNDPRKLLSFAKKNPGVEIFVHPRIHAKIFASEGQALIGSANLSTTGFSGAHEASLLTKDAKTVAALRTEAEKFIKTAYPASILYLERLVQAIDAGKASVQPTPDAAAGAAVAFAGQVGNPPFESFVAWLAGQNSALAKEVHSRCSGKKHNVSGHAYSAYHGLSVLFRGDPTWARSLIGQNWQGGRVVTGLDRIRSFVSQNPGLIKNKRRGSWENSYLPTSLGGPAKRSGGAGIGLIKRMMVLLPEYLKSVHLI